jgi:Tfp pilus assembly protein PilO
MRKPSFLERWGLVALVVAGIGYGYLNYLRDPLIEDYGKLVKSNNTLVQSLEGEDTPRLTEQIKQSIAEINKELGEMKTALGEVRADRLAGEGRDEEMVMRINEMAANNGLEIDKLAPFQPDKQDLFPREQSEQDMLGRSLYQVHLSGKFISLYEFFAEMSSLPSMVNATHLNIRKKEEGGGVDVELLFVI